MDKIKYVKLEQEDGSYSESIPLAVDANYVDVNGSPLTNVLDNQASKNDINNLQIEINSLASGSPLVASSVSEMVDTSRVYVNTTDGHWYYWNGTTWTDGGVYQAAEDSETLEILKQKIEVPYKIIENSVISGLWMGTNGKINTGFGDKLTIFPVEANKSYIIYSTNYDLNTSNYYFTYVGFSEDYPAENNDYTYILRGTGSHTITPIDNIYKTTENGYILIRGDASLIVSVWEIDNTYNSILEAYKKIRENINNINNLNNKTEIQNKIIDGIIENSLWMGTNGKINTSVGDKLTIFPVEANKKYIIYSTDYKLNTNGYYFAYLGFTNTYPAENNDYTQILRGTGNNDTTPINYTYNPTENGYILIRNEALSIVSVWEINSIYNSIIEIYKTLNEYNKKDQLTGCVFMSLGDSVTAEGYYIEKLRELIQPSKYYNLAVPSATWSDRIDTTSYDGNPSFSGDQTQNVLGNQLQKIINNPNIYDTPPDIILIAAGINDGNGTPYDNISKTATNTEIRNSILQHFKNDINSNTQIPITEPTFNENDTFAQHRKTVAGAMRYVITKLESMYPNAKIFISTPVQNSIYFSRDYMNIQHKQRYINETSKFLSVPVINIGEECGICSEYEYQGALWDSSLATETYPKMGRDLIDGLHPNNNGGWKIAKYIYAKIKEYFK